MIKLQTHCHTLGGSGCAHASVDELIFDLKSYGFDGAVLTNHYSKKHYVNYPGETQKQKLDFYFSLIFDAKQKFEKQGLKFFYGAEVQANLPNELFAEYVIYGFEPSFLYENKPLFELDQKELFELCESNGLFMYQAHPFRTKEKGKKGKSFLGDPKYMHGAEYFNGHVGHYNNNNLAREFCDKHNLIKMSGSDYHDKGQPILGGILVPDAVKDNIKLVKCIKRGDYKVIDDRKEYMRLTTKKEQVE